VLEPLGLRHEAALAVSGVDRLLRRGLDTPLPLWLTLLGGEARGSVRVTQPPELDLLPEGLQWSGPLDAGAEVELLRGKDVIARAWLRAEDGEARFRDVVHVSGLRSDLSFEKHYRLVKGVGGETGAAPPSLLSEDVMRPGTPVGARDPAAPRRAFPERSSTGSFLGLRTAQLQLEPAPVEIRNLEVELDLARGLPAVDRFQADLLGGAVVGSLEMSTLERGWPPRLGLSARTTFTGLDAARLGGGLREGKAGVVNAKDAKESELSGQFVLFAPLQSDLERMIAGVELEVGLTHIGSQTLDRALYAMDPSESNEAIVKQRKLLRIGSPRWVQVEARHGNLSVAGELQVGGTRLDLPRIERFNLADLPDIGRFGEVLARPTPALAALGAASADTLLIHDSGAYQFLSTE
jgi:hypothetical protein